MLFIVTLSLNKEGHNERVNNVFRIEMEGSLLKGIRNLHTL